MALRSRAKGSILGYTSRRQYDGDVGLRNALIRDGLVFGADLYRKDLYAHYGCVNAIEFSNDGEWLVSGNVLSCSLVYRSDSGPVCESFSTDMFAYRVIRGSVICIYQCV
ncbi:hypothetical protein MRX96_033754 [Rhipicephalus microplus]